MKYKYILNKIIYKLRKLNTKLYSDLNNFKYCRDVEDIISELEKINNNTIILNRQSVSNDIRSLKQQYNSIINNVNGYDKYLTNVSFNNLIYIDSDEKNAIERQYKSINDYLKDYFIDILENHYDSYSEEKKEPED